MAISMPAAKPTLSGNMSAIKLSPSAAIAANAVAANQAINQKANTKKISNAQAIKNALAAAAAKSTSAATRAAAASARVPGTVNAVKTPAKTATKTTSTGAKTAVKTTTSTKTATPTATSETPTQPEFTADQLYIDPTASFQPALDFINQQKAAAQKRYETNQANIKNIFSALSGISAQDTAAINNQFKTSIAEQQMGVAQRTAAATASQEAGNVQAAATGAERGAGPALQGSPTATATAEGIARANDYQTTWEALQRANQNQAVIDTQNRQAGYGQQEVGAIQQLASSLEDRLMQLGASEAGVQSDIAQAKYAGQQQVAQAKYGATVAQNSAAAQAAQAAAAQQAKYQTATDVAKINAASRLAVKKAGSSGSSATKTVKYPASASGWAAQLDASMGTGASSGLLSSISDAIAAVTSATKKATAPGKTAKITQSKVIAKLTKMAPGDAALPAAIDYINKYSGLPKG